jgi:uncharacterized protein YdaU (DUF1376 family)
VHYYQFNVGDYRKDTQHLTPIEHYVYRELIDWYYLDESPIPKKTDLVIRRLRLVSENKQDLTNVLEEFFTETEEGWLHGRIDEEILKYRAKSERAKVNGSKGGRPKKPRKTNQVFLGNPEKTESKANHKPLTINHKPLTNEKINRRFQRPTVEDIEKYVFEKTGKPDKTLSNNFFNHYESNGWKVGKNSMKNWRAAMSQWLTREATNNENNRFKSTTEINRPEKLTKFEQGRAATQRWREDHGIG